MATWYVNSAATGTGAGTSWTNACTTMAAAITLSAAGDDFNVASTHAETTSSALTLTFKGTAASPNRVFSCDTTNSPAQAGDLLAGASIATTGASAISVTGVAYFYGLTLSAGSSSNAASITINSASNGRQLWEACSFVLNNTSTSSVVNLSNSSEGALELLNCTMTFGAAGQGCTVAGGIVKWRDTAGAILGTAPTKLITSLVRTCIVRFQGVDLSALGSGHTLNGGAAAITSLVTFQNCRLGASVTVASTPTQSGVITDLIDSDSSATGYRQERYTYEGTLTASTSSYNNASDGVTPISWQVVTNANTKRQAPFECFEIVQWVAAGTYANTAVQITSATSGLTNADVWVDVEYLGNASYPLASLASSGPATQLTSGSSLAAGTWATGGLGNNYKLQVPSFTTALAGYVRFTVKVAKASVTVNIDPAVAVA